MRASFWMGGVVAAALLPLQCLAGTEPMYVGVHVSGEKLIIDVIAHARADREIVWEVLTDYDHMARFVSTLRSSQVIKREGNHLEVAQAGEARRGPFHFSFATVRAVELTPESEVRSTLISGDFKSYTFETKLSVYAAGEVTIIHHGEYVPKAWVPPILGPAMVETETRRQYTEILNEIALRQAKTH